MRINLLHKLLTLHEASSGFDSAKHDATLRRLFREQAAVLQAAEVAAGASARAMPLVFDMEFGPREEYSICGPRSRRRFVCRRVGDPTRPCVSWRIVEVPFAPERGSKQPHELHCSQEEAALKDAAEPFNDMAREHALPRVARACGACGAQRGAALKLCQACKQAHYCDATCQRRHWKQHRAACRAAAAAQQTNAQA